MSVTTEPAVSGVEAAPPPPGTVVWSMFSWSELLADGPWLEARWVPVAGGVASGRSLPDAQRNVLLGQSGGSAVLQRLAAGAGEPAVAPAARIVPLGLYMIR